MKHNKPCDGEQAKKANDNYDPHEHRNVPNATTNMQTLTHLLKASIGTGVLAMPSAYSNAGYIMGLVSTVIIGVIAVHCLHILIGSMYELCKRQRKPYITFSESMTIAFQDGPSIFRCLAPISMPLIDGFLAFYHFGICCVYIVFIAENIKQIADIYVIALSSRTYMCIIVFPLLLIYSIRNLKLLAPFSTVANILLLSGFAVVLYYICIDLPPITERQPFADVKNLPIFFGIVLFALEAVGVILAVEENMATPKAFVRPFGIMNIGMAVVVSLYVILGFLGYWKYGEKVAGSVTLNIPQHNIVGQIVKLIFTFATWITYALQGYVTVDIIWGKYLSKRVKDTSKHVWYELLVRATIVLCTLVCALIVPNLEMFLSLVGSFCLSILGLILPALLQILVCHKTGYGPLNIILIKNIILMTLGACGGIVGTYVSIAVIVSCYQ